MGKKRTIDRYPDEFRNMCLERVRNCSNISKLAEELGVHRRLLYKWRDQLLRAGEDRTVPENGKEFALRLQVAQLQRLVADKTLEADFFKGALQKVEARRRNNFKAGETASTTKSGS